MADGEPDSAEARLLRLACSGDRLALDGLYDRHRAALLAMVEVRMDRRLRARVDPSDVVQEAHLEAVRRLSDFAKRRPMPFALWVRKLAYERLLNLRRDHMAAARRSVLRELPLPEHSSLLLAGQLPVAGPGPGEQLDRAERASRVRQALARLPEDDREVLLLRYFDNLSNQQIAQLLCVSPGAVSKRHGRAILRLHAALTRPGHRESEP
jgi:RNA polymerase sigma-70 factor (ECF subfamily)